MLCLLKKCHFGVIQRHEISIIGFASNRQYYLSTRDILAREIGVSASFLSQIQHGKRPASLRVKKVLSNLMLFRMIKIAIMYRCWGLV